MFAQQRARGLAVVHGADPFQQPAGVVEFVGSGKGFDFLRGLLKVDLARSLERLRIQLLGAVTPKPANDVFELVRELIRRLRRDGIRVTARVQ
jgi:hypothetical protein